MMRFGSPLTVLAAAAAMLTSQSIVVTTAPQPSTKVPQSHSSRSAGRGRHRHRFCKVGLFATKPNSYSVKSWARYLARNGRDAVPIRSPEKFMHAAARRRFLFVQTSRVYA